MNIERIEKLYSVLVGYTNQYPQTWGQLVFQPQAQHSIMNELIFFSNELTDTRPYISSALFSLKDNLFTFQGMPNVVTYAEVMLVLDILLHEKDQTEVNNWNYIHPQISAVSKKLFEDGHFANAAVDAFIEINDRVKQLYKQIEPDGKLLDGQPLMNKMFSDEKPLLDICDRNVESGNDIHNGTRYMLTGAMSALRNPKSHANIPIDSGEAMRRLMFASMLMFQIDAAVERAGIKENR